MKAGSFEIRVPALSGSAEGSFPGFQVIFPLCAHMVETEEWERALWCLF